MTEHNDNLVTRLNKDGREIHFDGVAVRFQADSLKVYWMSDWNRASELADCLYLERIAEPNGFGGTGTAYKVARREVEF